MRAESSLPKGHSALNAYSYDPTIPTPQWDYSIALSSRPLNQMQPHRQVRWARPVVFQGMHPGTVEAGALRALDLISGVILFYGKPHSPASWRYFLNGGV
jgi:hypothetical protein